MKRPSESCLGRCFILQLMTLLQLPDPTMDSSMMLANGTGKTGTMVVSELAPALLLMESAPRSALLSMRLVPVPLRLRITTMLLLLLAVDRLVLLRSWRLLVLLSLPSWLKRFQALTTCFTCDTLIPYGAWTSNYIGVYGTLRHRERRQL